MSVVQSGVLLFCEGVQGGLDSLLLSRLLTGKSPGSTIVPAGGKYQMRAFIKGMLAASGSATAYVAFRDRDFDAKPPESVSLIQYADQSPTYMSHRAAVENYLLNAALLDAYWNDGAGAGPSWPPRSTLPHGSPPASCTPWPTERRWPRRRGSWRLPCVAGSSTGSAAASPGRRSTMRTTAR